MRFRFEHSLPLNRETVFAFFENPERLALLHAGWSRLRLLHCETQVRVGAETWVELTVAGMVPMVLGFRHALFEAPIQFGEEAIHGPFSRFIHIHEFEWRAGRTVVRDLLEIGLPPHYGGDLTMRRVVAPAVRRMFNKRAEVLTRFAHDGTIERCGSRTASAAER